MAEVLGHTASDAIDPERGLLELGFDSMMAVELRNRLNTATGLRLPTTVAFDHPSANELAAHVWAALQPAIPGPSDVLTGLQRLAEVSDATERDLLAHQLRAVLRTLEARTDPVAAVDDKSDEELFTLIDDVLGPREG
jgi:acyl carrier protein